QVRALCAERAFASGARPLPDDRVAQRDAPVRLAAPVAALLGIGTVRVACSPVVRVASKVSRPLMTSSRSTNFWILPLGVIGSSSRKAQYTGVLCAASWLRR